MREKASAPLFMLMKEFFIFKDRVQSGRFRWLGVYSNSFQDLDDPPDLIMSDAHKDAVRKIEIGEYEPPDLYIWHEEDWKIGVADYVFLDEVEEGIVFVVATGLIDEDKEFVVEPLSKVRSTMSQGLRFFDFSEHVNREGRKRDVREYRTYEISVLPEGIASPANPYTYFNMEAKMIDPTKRAALLAILSEEQLDALESQNKAIAGKAAEAGTQFKSQDEAAPIPTMDNIVNGTAPQAAKEETPVAPAQPVAEAVEEEVPVDEAPEEGATEITPEVVVELSVDDITAAIAAHVDARMGQFANAIIAIAEKQNEDSMALAALLARTEATEKDLGAVRGLVSQPPAATPAWDNAIFHMKEDEGTDSPAPQAPAEAQDNRDRNSLISTIFGGNENAS